MPKCKITYEYIQYDGLNGKEVIAFIKSHIQVKNLKFVWEEIEGTDTFYYGVKKLVWKCYDPKHINEADAEEMYMIEGQYAIFKDYMKGGVAIIPMSTFKSTYEEDPEINLSEDLLKNVPPYNPNPWYPGPYEPFNPVPPPQWIRPETYCVSKTSDGTKGTPISGTNMTIGYPGKDLGK